MKSSHPQIFIPLAQTFSSTDLGCDPKCGLELGLQSVFHGGGGDKRRQCVFNKRGVGSFPHARGTTL